MNLRDMINGMLSGSEPGANLADTLAENGFEGIDSTELSEALVHYSDQSSLDAADALAPITTRVSSVPFEPSDLTDSEFTASPQAEGVLDYGGDTFDLLADLEPQIPSAAEFDSHEPFDFAGDAEPAAFSDEVSPVETNSGFDPDFDQDHPVELDEFAPHHTASEHAASVIDEAGQHQMADEFHHFDNTDLELIDGPETLDDHTDTAEGFEDLFDLGDG